MEEKSVAEASIHLLAAEIIASNEDVLSEILLRLPVKSLIRFKLVSKDWRSFISKPQFGIRHTQISLKRNPGFLSPRGLFFYQLKSQDVDYISCIHSSETKKTDNNHFPSLSFLESALGSLVSVVHSCNGLSLCRFTSKYGFDYCICNLTTQEFSRVPRPPDDHPGSTFVAFALVYNPLESPYCKIVCLRDLYQINNPLESTLSRINQSHSTEILVYSSENGTWISKWCFQGFNKLEYLRTPSAYWNGGLYWIRNSECYRLDLNADEIKLKKIAPPGNKKYYWRDYADFRFDPLYLGEWCGHLHAVCIPRKLSEEFTVWELEDFSSEWFVKYKGNIASIISGYPEATRKLEDGTERKRYVSILAIVGGDKEEDSALVLAIPGKIISYKFTSGIVEVIREMSENMWWLNSNFYCFSYTQNLSPC